jgi:protease-4
MRKLCIVIFWLTILTIPNQVFGEMASYYERFNLLGVPPSTFQETGLGMANPANLYFLKNPELQFNWLVSASDDHTSQGWSLAGAVRGFGFGMIHRTPDDFSMNNYYLSVGFGNKSDALGIGYSWSKGDMSEFSYEKLLTLSAISRAGPFMSLGLTYSKSMESPWQEWYGEIGIRPFGNPPVTLVGDIAVKYGERFWDAPYSTGIIFEPVPGISLVGRLFDNKTFMLGANICLGTSSVSIQPHFDTKSKPMTYNIGLRSGGMRPSIINDAVERDRRYVLFNMKGTVEYNKYAFFNASTKRLMDILMDIRAAVDDPRISAIVMNLSGLRIYPEHAWEIREELHLARRAGKQVIIFIDEAGLTLYHLASVADKVVMDPAGSLRLPGIILGRTYFKGTLEKLGLGFDPWRFFKYKSAPEEYSREDMSEPDAEQNQAYLDDWYELVRGDVCHGRKITVEQFDKIINEMAYVLPEVALENNLIDTIGRWSDKNLILKNFSRKSLHGLAPKNLLANALPPRDWGEPRRIAVVYASGDCEMDRGIRARWLDGVIRSLADDKTVLGVVLRVDSPGGLMMPSDIVASAVKKCAADKPVIVSQGQVAASGGYMISTHADSILAGPNTVTGSIGVYGGWLYDKGIGDKIGMTSDYVSRGEHADLGFGIRLPYLGLQIPTRNLTDGERDKMEIIIRSLYDKFVGDVAAGRHKTKDEVKEIAEGRIYSGLDGKEIGLVDKIGGLMNAIDMVRRMAGVNDDEEISIIEMPKSRGLLDLRSQLNPLSISLESDPVYNYLRLLTENIGQPLPMLAPGMYPEME